ncbi:hypothetical protein RUM44_000921 [Polyplax serrata]|uniref:Uncharacterized protein n=1 Tax=Polyplax serrata TaxID=468196 RepID=A0ABR1B9D2_POLSC
MTLRFFADLQQWNEQCLSQDACTSAPGYSDVLREIKVKEEKSLRGGEQESGKLVEFKVGGGIARKRKNKMALTSLKELPQVWCVPVAKITPP